MVLCRSTELHVLSLGTSGCNLSKVEADMEKSIESLVDKFLDPVFQRAKSTGVFTVDKLKVSLNLCLKTFLERNFERLSKTKTLLYRDKPVALKKYYVRTDLVRGNEFSEDFGEIDEKQFLAELWENRRIVVTGTAGSGKSTFCKSVFVELVENPVDIVPIFVELRHLNSSENISIYDFIMKSLLDIEPTFTKQQFDFLLKAGKLLLILDGFDETSLESRASYEAELLKLAGAHKNIFMLVSSRVEDRFDSWEEFHVYKMKPLDKKKAIELISKIEYESVVKSKFMAALDENLFEEHESFAANPLLLTMMLLTYEQIAEIPGKRHLFYEQAFLTLFNKHDSLKSLYKRQSHSSLPLDDFKKVLCAFSILSYSEKKYSFTEEQVMTYIGQAIQISGVTTNSEDFLNDLLSSVCVLQRDGIGFTFTHRSFQEYFTALFVVSLVSDQIFEIIDQIAFQNVNDSVVTMIADMNLDLLEHKWLRQKLRSMIKVYDETFAANNGDVRSLGRMWRGIVSITRGKKSTDFGYIRHDSERSHDTQFQGIVTELYDDEFHSYMESLHTALTSDEVAARKELLEANFSETREVLFIDDFENLDAATVSTISRSGLAIYIERLIQFYRNKEAFLSSKYEVKNNELKSLLLKT